MKKSIYISVVLLVICSTVPIEAQKAYAGLLGGSNFADLDINFADDAITDYDVLSRTMFSFGGFLGIYLNESISIQLEPAFIEKGGVFRVSAGPELRIKSKQIDLPLIFKVEFGDMIRPYITGGGYISFVLDADVETELAGMLWKGDFTKVLNATEYGIVLGAGINIPVWYGSLLLEGRYSFGLTNLNKGGNLYFTNSNLVADGITTDPADEIKTIGIQILLGYQLPIGW